MQKQLSMLVLTLIAAALAGTAAAVLVSNSLERYAETLLNDRRFAALAPLQHSATPTTLEESLLRLQEVQLNARVSFVDADASSSVVAVGSDVVHGEGLIMSADGWIITDQAQLARYVTRRGTYEGFAVLQANKMFTVDRIVEDTQTHAIAIRVQNAQGWTPIELAENDEVLPGATVFGIGTLGEVYTTATVVRSIQSAIPEVPAEEPLARWAIAADLAPGTPVIDAQSRLFGFVNEEGMVMPAQALRPFIRQTLRGSPTITHAALGARILDLSQVSSLSADITQGYKEGVLIAPAPGERTGIIKNGPADRIGLVDGDILIAIDDVRITSTTTCADILATYAPGQEVTLRVVRNGEAEDMPVTLGTWEELVY